VVINEVGFGFAAGKLCSIQSTRCFMSLEHDASTVFDAALALPREKREELARQLVNSLLGPEQPKDPDYDRLLHEELDRRWAAYERGEVQTIDWREALDQIDTELDARRRS
jgi:putative addiction module component (TIGR02574 family)